MNPAAAKRGTQACKAFGSSEAATGFCLHGMLPAVLKPNLSVLKGQVSAAKNVLNRTLEMVAEEYRSSGSIYEFYDARPGRRALPSHSMPVIRHGTQVAGAIRDHGPAAATAFRMLYELGSKPSLAGLPQRLIKPPSMADMRPFSDQKTVGLKSLSSPRSCCHADLEAANQELLGISIPAGDRQQTKSPCLHLLSIMQSECLRFVAAQGGGCGRSSA